MKICHVSVATLKVLHPRGGAIQRRIIEIAREQFRLGHKVVVFSIGDNDSVEDYNGIEIIYIKCKARMPLRAVEFQWRVIRNIRNSNCEPEVIHFHSQPEGAILSVINRLKAKTLLSYDYFIFRGGKRTPLYYLYRWLVSRFDLLLPVSTYCKDQSVDYWQLPEFKVRVLYNGVNTAQFFPSLELKTDERKRLGIRDQKVVLYVGRVCKQKGTEDLLATMDVLGARRQDLRLVIAGPLEQFGTEGNDTVTNWVSSIEAHGGLYLGAVEESQLNAIYNLADIFVMPTRELEMFGMAAVEAQACGKPVIASDHGGLKETVPESCGVRFAVGDVQGLADRIEWLADSDDVYTAKSINALENAKRFDWTRICNDLEQFIIEAL